MAQDTGTFKVTDTYLKDFANHQIQNFLDDCAKNPAILSLMEFANGAGGDPSTNNFDKILDGNGNALSSAGQLQSAFKSLANSLRTQVQGLTDTMNKAQRDLLQVDYYLTSGDHNAELTASQMGQDLQDILGGLNAPPTNPNTPPKTNTPPPTTGH